MLYINEKITRSQPREKLDHPLGCFSHRSFLVFLTKYTKLVLYETSLYSVTTRYPHRKTSCDNAIESRNKIGMEQRYKPST